MSSEILYITDDYQIIYNSSNNGEFFGIRDIKKNTFVENYLPNHKIGILHFAGKNNDQIRNDKNFISKIETVDGDIIDKKLRFNN